MLWCRICSLVRGHGRTAADVAPLCPRLVSPALSARPSAAAAAGPGPSGQSLPGQPEASRGCHGNWRSRTGTWLLGIFRKQRKQTRTSPLAASGGTGYGSEPAERKAEGRPGRTPLVACAGVRRGGRLTGGRVEHLALLSFFLCDATALCSHGQS